jgi:hypothetical protein
MTAAPHGHVAGVVPAFGRRPPVARRRVEVGRARRLGRQGRHQGQALRGRPAGAVLVQALVRPARPTHRCASPGAASGLPPPAARDVQRASRATAWWPPAQELPDRDAAEALPARASSSRGPVSRRPTTDEFYWVDLIGLAVRNRQGWTWARWSACSRPARTACCVSSQPPLSADERADPFVDAYVDRVDPRPAHRTSTGTDY